jgi:hypothetical protein
MIAGREFGMKQTSGRGVEMSYYSWMAIAQHIEPISDPNSIVEGEVVSWVCYCLLHDAAAEELLGKSCPPPEHLRGVLVRLAEEHLKESKVDLSECWSAEDEFDAHLNQWAEWYEYGVIKLYCDTWKLGDMPDPDRPEPGYTGPFEKEWEHHTTCFRESFQRSGFGIR